MFEKRSDEAFGEDVGLLFLCVDLVNFYVPGSNMGAEEMVFDGDMFGARRHAGKGGKDKSAVVVLKDSREGADLEDLGEVEGERHLTNDCTKGEEFAHGLRECDILRLHGAEGNFSL